MVTVVQAIRSLRPNSEFVIKDNDLENIEWLVLEGVAPTKIQIQKAIKDLETAELAEVDSKTAAKTALLERLGITADEATLLLS